MEQKIKCQYCNKEYSKKGIATHIWRNHGKGIEHNSNQNRVAWNKGLTKENDEIVAKIGKTISKVNKGKPLKEETKQKISDKLKGKTGGYRPGSGHGKHGWYKGYWCDSSWELAFTIYNLEHNIKFERNTQKFEYEFEDKKHNYYPDFIMEDGSYIEIKGYENGLTNAKINNFPFNIKIIYYKQIKSYLEYVENKYGKDFIKLYDNQKISKKQIQKGQKKLKLIKEKENLNKQIINNKINLIINSNIDFSKFGWVQKVSEILEITPQKVNKWMKRNMLEFYNTKCFKRK